MYIVICDLDSKFYGKCSGLILGECSTLEKANELIDTYREDPDYSNFEIINYLDGGANDGADPF